MTAPSYLFSFTNYCEYLVIAGCRGILIALELGLSYSYGNDEAHAERDGDPALKLKSISEKIAPLIVFAPIFFLFHLQKKNLYSENLLRQLLLLYVLMKPRNKFTPMMLFV